MNLPHLQTINFDNDTASYVAPTWFQMEQLIFSIAEKIISNSQQFDRVITLSKGGWPMARPLIDYLQISDVASIGVQSYTGINEHTKRPELYQDLLLDISGENILLFDDVADTGESLAFVKEHLEKKGVSSVTCATLFYKQHSKIIPEYYGVLTADWIIFPYELRETMTILVPKWRALNVSDQEIVQRFAVLGFNKEMIEYFLKV